jgi:peptidoglycan/LPS O-acetylase OafA/YrhL
LLLVGLITIPTRLLSGLFALWVLFVGVRIFAVLFQAPHPMIWTSVFSADSLLLGTALGVKRPSPPSPVFARIIIVIIGIVALFSGALMPPIDEIGTHQVIVYSLIAVGAAALTTAALHEPFLGFLKERPLRYLGKISYGLYVFHLLGIAIGSSVATQIKSESYWVSALAAFAVTTFLSVLSYELFERQFLKLKHRFETVHSRPI